MVGAVQVFEQVWETVRDTLCNDAPEGYVPDDAADSADMDIKSALSYSWRALKEASNLLRTIVLKAPATSFERREGQWTDLQPLDLEKLVRLSFVQLTELRHRGAFSAVAQAFAAGCSRCRLLGRDDILVQLYQVRLHKAFNR